MCKMQCNAKDFVASPDFSLYFALTWPWNGKTWWWKLPPRLIKNIAKGEIFFSLFYTHFIWMREKRRMKITSSQEKKKKHFFCFVVMINSPKLNERENCEWNLLACVHLRRRRTLPLSSLNRLMKRDRRHLAKTKEKTFAKSHWQMYIQCIHWYINMHTNMCTYPAKIPSRRRELESFFRGYDDNLPHGKLSFCFPTILTETKKFLFLLKLGLCVRPVGNRK